MPENNLQENIIISDTTCLIAFTNANKLNILKSTYDNIEVTLDVKKEYESKKGDVLPDWITVKEPNDIELVNRLKKDFGAGESQSIVLAIEEKKSLLVLDDKKARDYAINKGLNVTGTLGVINKARNKDILTLDEAVDIVTKMKNNNFHLSGKLLNNFIEDMKGDDKKKIMKEISSMGYFEHKRIDTSKYNTWENMNAKLETEYIPGVAKYSMKKNDNSIYILMRSIDKNNIDIFLFRNNFTEKQGIQFLKNFYNEQQKNGNTNKNENHILNAYNSRKRR
jgi:predicted nucleic acid-binding protein